MPATEPTKDELKAQKDELVAQLEATRRDMEILAALARERATATVYQARDAAYQRVDELSAEARALLGTARAEALRWTDEASDQVRRNPLTAIAIAFGLGWLIGLLNRK